MAYSNTIKTATLTIPVWPVLQALSGLFVAFVSVIALGKLIAHTLMRLVPELAQDNISYDTVIASLLINVGLFVVLRRRTPVFSAFFLMAVLLLTALPITAWFAA